MIYVMFGDELSDFVQIRSLVLVQVVGFSSPQP